MFAIWLTAVECHWLKVAASLVSMQNDDIFIFHMTNVFKITLNFQSGEIAWQSIINQLASLGVAAVTAALIRSCFDVIPRLVHIKSNSIHNIDWVGCHLFFTSAIHINRN